MARDEQGRCVVRLDNGHLVAARDVEARGGEAAACRRPGRRVGVEMSSNETKGWRIARRP
jgi:hypothetical protein